MDHTMHRLRMARTVNRQSATTGWAAAFVLLCVVPAAAVAATGGVAGMPAMAGVTDSVAAVTPTTVALCGNGTIDPGEDCDDGGICIGGDSAGTRCTAESDCAGNGVCMDGAKRGTSCASDADCSSGPCRHCVPQGGDGCAANCTNESDVPFSFAPAVITVVGAGLTQAVPFEGKQLLTVGRELDGRIPLVIKAAAVRIPAVDVSGLACACIRGIAAKTCGGTVFESDGTLTPDCTLDDRPCVGRPPCTFVHGPDNAATGIVGCDGLAGVNVSDILDLGANTGPLVTFSGSGQPGSAVVFDTVAIGTVVGACSGTAPAYGDDGAFCTDDDPPGARGLPMTLPFTTGTAMAEILDSSNPNGTQVGPATASGAPFSCTALQNGDVAGTALATAFTERDLPIIGNAVAAGTLAAEPGAPTPPPVCCAPLTQASDVCIPVPCTPTIPGTPTPTPTPEGACYSVSADCTGQAFRLTSQSECCSLTRKGGVALPLSWCPAGQFDPSNGQCSTCQPDPCAGLPTPTPTPSFPACCDPGLGIACPFDFVCPPPTGSPPPTFGGCDLACDDRPCLGTCADGTLAKGTCSALTVDRGCMCVPDCSVTPTPVVGGCGPVCDPTRTCLLPVPGGAFPAKGTCSGESPNGCVCVPGLPTPAAVQVDVGIGAGVPGDTVSIDVSLYTAANTVAAVQNDIRFDRAATPITECAINANIAAQLTLVDILPDTVRAIVVATGLGGLPDRTVLYTCTVAIAADAAPGFYVLRNSIVVATDFTDQPLRAIAGSDGVIVVNGATQGGESTPTASVAPQLTQLPSPTSNPAGTPQTAEGGGPTDLSPGTAAPGGGCTLNPGGRHSAAALLVLVVPALLVWRRKG